MFSDYDVARGVLKLQCKTCGFHARSYSVNSKGYYTCVMYTYVNLLIRVNFMHVNVT